MSTAPEIRARFMEEYAEDLLDLYGQAALGQTTFFKTIPEARRGMFETLKTVLVQAGDLQRLNAQSTQDVIGLLADGKVTVDDALKLMQILDKQQVIDTVPELERKVAELSQSTKQVGR